MYFNFFNIDWISVLTESFKIFILTYEKKISKWVALILELNKSDNVPELIIFKFYIYL